MHTKHHKNQKNYKETQKNRKKEKMFVNKNSKSKGDKMLIKINILKIL